MCTAKLLSKLLTIASNGSLTKNMAIKQLFDKSNVTQICPAAILLISWRTNKASDKLNRFLRNLKFKFKMLVKCCQMLPICMYRVSQR